MMGEATCLCAKGKKGEVEYRERKRGDGQASGDGIQDTGCGIGLQQKEGYFILWAREKKRKVEQGKYEIKWL